MAISFGSPDPFVEFRHVFVERRLVPYLHVIHSPDRNYVALYADELGEIGVEQNSALLVHLAVLRARKDQAALLFHVEVEYIYILEPLFDHVGIVLFGIHHETVRNVHVHLYVRPQFFAKTDGYSYPSLFV